MDNILKVLNITKSFNGFKAVDDVSFDIETGSINGLIGENGAGKTTLFNILSGFENHIKGKIVFMDMNINSSSALARAKMGIGRLFQNPHIFNNLSVIDNLLVSAISQKGENILNYILRYNEIKIIEKNNRKSALEILEQIGLADKKNELASSFSYGQKKLLSIGMLLMSDTKLILLDEPYSGLNPSMIDKINQIIKKLSDTGISFIIIEHNIKALKSISHKLIKMNSGRIVENINLLSSNGCSKAIL